MDETSDKPSDNTSNKLWKRVRPRSTIGRLELIIGCMFAGKSSEMIRRYRRYSLLHMNVLVISHTNDTRYGENVVSSHNKDKIECISCDTLLPIFEMLNYRDIDVIMVEEAQFFKDLMEFVINAVDIGNKIVIVSGLSGDCFRKPFGQILDLIPIADHITHLKALCTDCANGTPAIFSKRVVPEGKQLLVGGSDTYKAVCRHHFMGITVAAQLEHISSISSEWDDFLLGC